MGDLFFVALGIQRQQPGLQAIPIVARLFTSKISE
jgi:hypothetical protein